MVKNRSLLPVAMLVLVFNEKLLVILKKILVNIVLVTKIITISINNGNKC